MADQKISALTEDTTPARTDLLYKVDSGGTTDRKVTIANLLKQALAGDITGLGSLALLNSLGHSATTGQTVNDHHNKSHVHDGADGSGTVAYSALTGKPTLDTVTAPAADVSLSSHKITSLAAPTATSDGARFQDTMQVAGVNAQTGTTYTFVLGDAGKLVTSSNSSAQTVSVPTNASVAFPTGTIIQVAAIGTGQVTINAVTPGTTTIGSTGATATAPKLRAQYSSASLVKTATDTWLVLGDLA